MPRRSEADAPRVLIIVQNMPVPQDRRVWLECQELTAAGYAVSVICPAGPGDSARDVIDGINLYKYGGAPATSGVLSFAFEFLYCWIRTAWLSLVVWRHGRFDIIQTCNPPDTYWLLARLWRLRGVRFVYDQHDLNPELYLSRFGEPTTGIRKALYRGLVWLERMTYRSADHVISTNQSYKRIAVTRGGRDPGDVTVVRSGPHTSWMRPVQPARSVYRGGDHLLVYLGIMGPQDNVDVILDVMEELVYERGRTGVRAALLGYGDCLAGLMQRSTELQLDDFVEFTDRADSVMIADYLSSADIGLSPDLKTPLNDASTMNKTMEYMAYCLPSVSFDLHETRVSAGDTALFVEPGNIHAFADAVEMLLDDGELRTQMGLAARRRVVAHLDWRTQAPHYVNVFNRLTNRPVTHQGGAEKQSDGQLHPDHLPGDALADPTGLGIDEYIVHRWRRA